MSKAMSISDSGFRLGARTALVAAIASGVCLAQSGLSAEAVPGGPAITIGQAAMNYKQGNASTTVELAAIASSTASSTQAVPLTPSGTNLQAPVNGGTLTVAKTGRATLSADGVPSLGISPKSTYTTTQTASGALVGSKGSDGKDVVVRATQNGVQLVSVLPNAASTLKTSFNVSLPPGARLVPSDGGTIDVVAPVQSEEVTDAEVDRVDAQVNAILDQNPDADELTPAQVAQIDAIAPPAKETVTEDVVISSASAPWAFDAKGNVLNSHYEVSGSTVTQVIDATASTTFPVTADPSWFWWTKNIAVCAAQVASILVPGKLAQVSAKIAKAAKTNSKVKRAKSIISDFGGLGKTVKKVAKYAKSKGKGLSKTDKARVENLFSYGGAVLVDIMGLGGCYTIFKQVT